MRANRVPLAAFLVLLCFVGFSTFARAGENPAFWKHQVKGDFNTVLANMKSGIEAKQFLVTEEENLSKGLENNKQVFGDKWNTIGFQNVTALHFCSLALNQEVFNINMDWSILCPFKVVLYTMKGKPDQITVITTRPSYLLQKDPHPRAKEIGKKVDERVLGAIKEAISQ